MRSLAIVLAVLSLVAVACKEPNVANRCAGPEPKCMTRVVCAHDAARGCEVCTCDSPFPASSVAPEAPPVR